MGNLCLDFGGNIANVRNYAWSSDVGHYLTVNKNKVMVYRWDRYQSNNYDANTVAEKLNDFYEYLKKQEINKHESIIKFSIQLYRKIRSLLRDNNGGDSLNVLLYLFACVADNKDRNKVILKNWAISKKTRQIVEEINGANWDELQSLFIVGMQSKELQPDVNLLLRHASGSLFQEAHFETLFPQSYQLTLPGILPGTDELLTEKHKEQTSAHFTPTSAVRTIVEESIRNFSFKGKKDITVLDPACGSGEFLKEFLRQINLKGFRGHINLVGWDISETAIDMANFIVNHEAKPFKGNVTIKIEQKDALVSGKTWEITADFVLMNPPFISWEKMVDDQKEQVASILGGLNSKRPNTAGAFLWNATQCLKKDGIIGCVLPTSIFENESYIPLREEVKSKLDIRILGRLGSNTLFIDTLVDTAIFLGVNQRNKTQNPLIFWSDYKKESASSSLREMRKMNILKSTEGVDGDGYSLYRNSELIKGESWMPIPRQSFELLNRFQNFTRVEDIFEIFQGVRTGLNSAFIVPREFYNICSNKEKKYFRPAVTNDSIVNGKLVYSYYMFYPTGEQVAPISTEEELKKATPNFYKSYFLPNKSKLAKRKGVKELWDLTRSRNWAKPFTPKIVSKEFGKAGDFAFDKDGLFIPERSHAWFPKKNNLDEIGYAYVCILSMPIINEFLTGLSKQLGGGNWWYLSSKYLNKMPLPDLFDTNKYNSAITTELIGLGLQLSKGEKVNNEQLIELSKIVFYG